MHKNGTSVTAVDPVEAALAAAKTALAERERALETDRAKVVDLERRVRLAKGTRTFVPISLEDRVVTALRTDALSVASLAAQIGVPVGRIQPVVARLRADKRLHNVGSEVEPKWLCSLGDDGPVAELKDFVLKLISERPWTFRELVAISGARDNRVSGVLNKLKEQTDIRVLNLGDGARGRWFALRDLK